MKLLILGAGASKPAGYPLAAELMVTMEEDAKASRNAQLERAWEHWQETRGRATGPLRLLLEDPNPEVILTVLDLCSMSHYAGFEQLFKSEAKDKAVGDSLSDSLQDDSFTSPDHKWLYDADTARFRLLDCLIAYFDWKHYEDSRDPVRREYLQRELAKLKCGDVVITLNWDSASERTLLEAGRWSPRDGYGFVRGLQSGEFSPLEPISGRLAEPSQVLVLKLHGSVGWHRWANEIYLSNSFLNDLLPPSERLIRDPLALRQGGRPDYDPVIAYPSFLKSLDSPPMLDLWQQADAALRATDEIEIWGYSLPRSDTAMRALLNSVRGRTRRGGVSVIIHVPGDSVQAGETRDRWRTFLAGAIVDKQKLG
ncbi:MAG: hypothetical protein ACLQDV_23090 [Candidatus Binataceae bacterium]